MTAVRRVQEATGDADRDLTTPQTTGDEGFTLVELLVVILIIAILLTVGALKLLGLRKNAYDSAAKQELGKVRTAEEIYINTGPGETSNSYGTLAALAGDPSDYTPSDAVTSVSISVSNGGYTAVAVSKSGKSFQVSSADPAPTEVTAP